MKTFAFISRHAPTQEQYRMATNHGITLVPIGDRDAFTVSLDDVWHPTDPDMVFDGVVVVHPAAALNLIEHYDVGVFENSIRRQGQFEAVAFHVWQRRT